MPKTRATGWSVAGQRKLDTIKEGMPPEMVAQIKQAAIDQSVADVFGADWKQHVDVNGNPQEQGIGSDIWLINVEEKHAERHYAAIGRFVGPAAEKAARERIARLKAAKGRQV